VTKKEADFQSASFLTLHLLPKFALNHYILRFRWYFMVIIHKSDGKFLYNLLSLSLLQNLGIYGKILL